MVLKTFELKMTRVKARIWPRMYFFVTKLLDSSRPDVVSHDHKITLEA